MRRIYNIGDKIGTHIIIGLGRNKNRSIYLVKCEKCNLESKRVSTQLINGNRCTKCNIRNLIGSKNNKCTFIEYINNGKYNCLCDCGKQFIGRERSMSCGCHLREISIMKAQEMVGIKHGSIKILRFSHMEKKPSGLFGSVYEAKCKCGKKFLIKRGSIFQVKSCGCRIDTDMACGERQGNNKYNEKDVLAIRELFLTGHYSKKQLSEMFQFPISAINDFIMVRSWKHLKCDDEVLRNSPVKDKYARTIPKIVIGSIYGQWTVLKKIKSKNTHGYHLCRCSCGDEYEVTSSSLRNGKSTKCYWCNSRNFANLNRKNLNPEILL